MFERRTDPLLPRREFIGRLARGAVVGLGLIAVSLFIGMLGYHLLEGFSWLDAFVNASMLLGGMGPVDPLHTTGGKLFAGFYALYCGFMVLAIAGIIFAPILHRFLHRFHLEHARKN
jgi:NO-binding membrane sensor protein with MHYT domain